MSDRHQQTDMAESKPALSFEDFKQEVLNDYRIACESREASLLGRKEVLTGKAKFGIFGDGKEVAQLALAKAFKNGDFRSGYYRDQTFMFAIGEATLEQFFAQLYANPDLQHDPFSAGRQMNAHFATRSLDENGEWKDLTKMKNSSSDISPTAGQMLRALGLAQASKVYRENSIADAQKFSINGNEIAIATIGDASTSEGIFWETVNAAGVLRVPLAICVWDDGYGISVPRDYQTVKGSISMALSGFQIDGDGKGIDIYVLKGWDYPGMCETFAKGIERMRETHIPALFHVTEVTQPQGHSTSGSHERYKSKERLEWEKEYDGNRKFREWILQSALADEAALEQIEQAAKQRVQKARKVAWEAFLQPIKEQIANACGLFQQLETTEVGEEVKKIREELQRMADPFRKDVLVAINKALLIARNEKHAALEELKQLKSQLADENAEKYNSYLHSQSAKSALNVAAIAPSYDEEAPYLNGSEILNKTFDLLFSRYDNLLAFGEDLGKIGDVNQGFAGLQEKYGESRIFDVGIREASIMGQGIGMALRGLRPIAEIQYLDYLLYGLQPLSDDLATLQYRTKGGQKAPLIIRTRGHRLEGIWHTGSPMGMIINSLRGIHVCVPRDMTRAAGFYNTLLQSDEPALVIECLNGYRLKERLPSNLGTYTTSLGVPEVLQEGTDVTLVSYGSTLRVAAEAIRALQEVNVSVELIDVQTLLPFDLQHIIAGSLKKTSRLVVVDEDVPGGASAYILQHILQEQKGYYLLDAEPLTITAKAHRSPYGSDGDYFSKPNAEELFEAIYRLMHESAPSAYPLFF
ncbi:MAG: thiamine pyrophosphate-dependent enzyme [Chitinophagales bacterium]|nr:thiamine pyrophosphate-dependent enzyme [Chitinophagales bacterium]